MFRKSLTQHCSRSSLQFKWVCMRIAILTSGRFHVCDLARELDAIGHEVAFYSLVPPWRTGRFGLPKRCNRWLAPYVAPLLATSMAVRNPRLKQAVDAALALALDQVAARLISRCDVFVGMSGLCMASGEAVRRKYRARILVERGSRHIQSQREILGVVSSTTRTRNPVSNRAVARELQCYEMADVIVVPAKHVVRSFVERGVPESKLFRNPYGVDLTMFRSTQAPPDAPPRVLTVGAWSLRKGADVLLEAWRRLPGTKLMHVGPLGDVDLPKDANFEHHSPVDQSQLASFYSQNHVFAMASREEGLALVQPQAIACGLRLVCTDRTGGEDLAELLVEQDALRVVASEDASALASALKASLSRKSKGMRDLLGASRNRLSWRAYGERYDRMLREGI